MIEEPWTSSGTLGGPSFDRALALAVSSHQGQIDKAGHPYVLHPVAVAAAVADHGEVAMCVALLHDVVEDTPVTIDDVRVQFGDDVARRVALLTKQDDDSSYDHYLQTICEDEIAATVKLADMRHNLGRVDQLPDVETRERLRAKYEPWIALLESVLADEPAILDFDVEPPRAGGSDADWAALYVMVSDDGSVAKVGACERFGNVPNREKSVSRKYRTYVEDPGASMRTVAKMRLRGLSMFSGGDYVDGWTTVWAEIEALETAMRLALARRLGHLHGWVDYVGLTDPVDDRDWPRYLGAAWAEVAALGGTTDRPLALGG